jgi:hypothetical protein
MKGLRQGKSFSTIDYPLTKRITTQNGQYPDRKTHEQIR